MYQFVSKRYFYLTAGIFALIFHALFINQGIGLNWVFIQLLLIITWFNWQKLPLKAFNKLVVISYLISIYGIIAVHSVLAIWVNSLLFLLLATSIASRSKNILENFVLLFLRFEKTPKEPTHHTRNRKSIKNWFSFLLIPFAILCLFFFLYAQSIPHFYSFFTRFLDFLPELRFQNIMLFILGFALALNYWSNSEPIPLGEKLTNEIQLRHKSKDLNHLEIGLRNEAQQWTLTLIGLLFMGSIALCMDIRFIWFSDSNLPYEEAKWALHKGTAGLIAAILASIFFSLYVYRGNLSFYTHQIWLKRLNLAWLLLNGMLCLSLLIRTIYYVQEYNLAYKRIGVVVFILCALWGIASVIYRMYKRKNVWFLVRVNLNMILCTFVLLSCVNWDKTIVRYNLNHPEAYLDYDFLFTRELSVVLEADFSEEILDRKIPILHDFRKLTQRYGKVTYGELLDQRMQQWIEKNKVYDLRSWNGELIRNNRAVEIKGLN